MGAERAPAPRLARPVLGPFRRPFAADGSCPAFFALRARAGRRRRSSGARPPGRRTPWSPPSPRRRGGRPPSRITAREVQVRVLAPLGRAAGASFADDATAKINRSSHRPPVPSVLRPPSERRTLPSPSPGRRAWSPCRSRRRRPPARFRPDQRPDLVLKGVAARRVLFVRASSPACSNRVHAAATSSLAATWGAEVTGVDAGSGSLGHREVERGS